MANKLQLSKQRAHTVINKISKKQESKLVYAVKRVASTLAKEFPKLRFQQETQWHLNDVIARLQLLYKDVPFCSCFARSSMRPDGGILSVLDKEGHPLPILISEKKNQGTNDLRLRVGKKKQTQGNAIERLGKNVIGFRTSLLTESIFPFVCFGDGCDFADDSSIVDRVKTIAMFGSLNEVNLHNTGPQGVFNRGSFFFRVPEWTEKEMYEISLDIARRSVLYYLSKYGDGLYSK